jgi:hypothetical protein
MLDSNNRSHSIPLDELECYQDAEWALHNPEVQSRYSGQWAVAHKGKVIATGSDLREVVAEASRIAPGLRHLAVYCASEDSDLLLEDSSDRSFDLADG